MSSFLTTTKTSNTHTREALGSNFYRSNWPIHGTWGMDHRNISRRGGTYEETYSEWTVKVTINGVNPNLQDDLFSPHENATVEEFDTT